MKNIFFYSMMLIACFNLLGSQSILTKEKIVISDFRIDEFNNEIDVYINKDILSGIDYASNENAAIQLDMTKGDRTYSDLIIKNMNSKADGTIIFSVQTPLTDAKYRGEKREFSIRILREGKNIKKQVVLGSIMNPYDLRIYTFPDKIRSLIIAGVLIFLLTVLLMLIYPLYQKFKFKKNYIKKYKKVDEQDVLDPFTFVTIEDKDDIVAAEDTIMLLSSWKRLNLVPNSLPAQKYQSFFMEEQEGTFFNPKTTKLKLINKVWFSIIGIFTGWLCFISFKEPGIELFNVFTLIFNTQGLQVSFSMAADVFLGFCVASGYCLALLLADCCYTSFRNITFTSFVLGIATITTGFLIQSLISTFLIGNRIGGAIVSWTIIAFVIGLARNFKLNLKRVFMKSLVVGLLSFGISEIGKIEYFIKILGIDTSIFLGLLTTGIGVLILTNVPLIIYNKITSRVKNGFSPLVNFKNKKESFEKEETSSIAVDTKNIQVTNLKKSLEIYRNQN